MKLCAFLEGVRARCPDNFAVLEALGDSYTKTGQITKGLEIDEYLTGEHPDNSMYWYNLACSYALLNRCEEALKALKSAIDHGYDDHVWMLKDKDLDALKHLPSFNQLLQRVVSMNRKRDDDEY